MGGAVRLERLIGQQSKTSVFARGNGQITLRRFSAYVNFESGNDLANRTLFATSIVSTTVIGAALHLSAGWDLTAETFRNNLTAELNPQNVFVLQGQGVYVPVLLSALRQRSVYFRMTKRFNSRKAVPLTTNSPGNAIGQHLLNSSSQGFSSA